MTMTAKRIKKYCFCIIGAMFLYCVGFTSLVFADNGNQPEPKKDETASVRICSFNLRGSARRDKGVRNWSHRKRLVAQFFKDKDIDVCGTQESSNEHLRDFAELLPQYGLFGLSSLGERDGRVRNLVMYKKERFKLLKRDTFWLSTRPNDPMSKDWNSSEPRTATYVKLLDKKSGTKFFVFSTHIDVRSSEARDGQMKVLFSMVKEIVGKYPFVVVGDFNTEEDTPPIKYVLSLGLVNDARKESKSAPVGPDFTFHGFKGVRPDLDARREDSFGGPRDAQNFRIDYIFVSPKTEVLNYEVSTYNKDGAYPSDHFPTISDLVFKQENK